MVAAAERWCGWWLQSNGDHRLDTCGLKPRFARAFGWQWHGRHAGTFDTPRQLPHSHCSLRRADERTGLRARYNHRPHVADPIEEFKADVAVPRSFPDRDPA